MHTGSIFERLGTLRIEDVFFRNQSKFRFNLLNNNLHVYFESINVKGTCPGLISSNTR